MRIESALFASREGIAAHGAAISVVGNNISNTNTVAFKSARAEFADLFSESGIGGGAGTDGSTGNGVTLSRVRNIFATGPIELTGRSLDVGIDGGGFLMLSGESGATYYSRAGNLQLSESGILTNAGGLAVQGYTGTGTELGDINLFGAEAAPTATANVTLVGNVNAAADIGAAPANPATYRELNATASFLAPASVLDSLGARHDLTIAVTKTALGTWVAQAYIDAGDVGGTAGVPQQLGGNLTLNFGADGHLTADPAPLVAQPAYSNGAAAGNISIDFSGFSQFSQTSELRNVTQDGEQGGTVKDYKIASDGSIYGILDSDEEVFIGRIPLANFRNVDGLDPAGNTLYIASSEAGEAIIANPGEGNLGLLAGSSLEGSTVDIAGEFVNLVLYQRGYQANSQTLSATNDLITQTIGLIR